MSYGIVITKAGYDATSGAVADKNKIFDSSLDHLKTFSSGNFEQTVAAWGSYSGYVTHSLGYNPLCLCYFSTDDGDNYRICFGAESTPARYSINWASVLIAIDDTKVYFHLDNVTSSSIDFLVKYEIFYEGA